MSQGIERFFLLTYCLACCWPGLGARSNLRIVQQWTELEFAFPSEEAKQKAIDKRFFVTGNSIPIDLEVYHRPPPQSPKTFITIPRFSEGRPITLGTLDENGTIHAYPDYSWHDDQGTNCDGLTSVFRVAVDGCQRLWVMDTGKIDNEQKCAPQLLAFDLTTDRVIYRHVVNQSSYTSESLFVTPVVDIRPRAPKDCAQTFVYVADVTGYALLVVDVLRNRSWRAKHRLFYPYPNKGNFTIDGESFDLMDGILGMALTPYKTGRDRYLYFHALASTTENVLNTKVIRNNSLLHNSNLDSNAVYSFPQERSSQSAAEAMDSDGILYFGLMNPPSIWCWNSATEFSRQNFHLIAVDQETLQFASGVKVVKDINGEEELWVLTCSFQRVMTGTLNSDRVNFRIHTEKISKILKDSPCKDSPKGIKPSYLSNLVEQSG